ncbi:MAG: lactonase family protein [Bacteroidetes bacterium]|nr:MAG: lactonase family protein [Bacteroidota bacterium]
MKKFNLIVYSILIILMFSTSCNCQPIRLLAGKYTKEGEKGLYLLDLNREKGTFKLLSESDAGPNPTYYCISKKNGLIYAANEVTEFKGVRAGGVTTLSYNSKSGIIEKINELIVPDGGPCFISLSAGDDFLFMANYSGGSVAVIRLDKNGIPTSVTDTLIYKEEDGNISHAHMIATDPSGKRVYVTDLGLDRILTYNLDNVSGRLNPIKNCIVNLTKGAGPRHFVFSSDGTKMYVICELKSTVSVFDVAENGELVLLQTITTLNEVFKGESFCADIHIGKTGDFLYGSNRGENTIVTFRIGSDGKLSLAGRTDCGGNWPRNFVIDPSGKYILVGNQRSGNISLFKIDKKTGIPIESGKDFKITSPACLKFL